MTLQSNSLRGRSAEPRGQGLLALAFHLLAVEAIVEAAGAVALGVTLPIVKVLPALQGPGAVLPGVAEVEGAVPPVKAAGVVVALGVAELVARLAGAARDLALLLGGGGGDVLPPAPWEGQVQDVAVEPIEAGGAEALVMGRLLGKLAGAPVVAGAGVAGAAGGELAGGAREARQAQALRGAPGAGGAAPAIQAAEGPAAAGVIFTSSPFKALRTEGWDMT